ncbi:hypothetical protein AciX8_3241 [Granulicella mallensis MP5ACTX8]|uniref:Uncharacterized protein n=1 Tax=Granulicella mallensis (strain ATCC BAA-1857 / DSM 23137 / MP5ACTX8) TaxID=682795 RepID=G8NTY6_GRAMM|nr:hypothetical protein AciX8_3241 [Granulicella mallensis MP5ACTX8]
MWLTGPTSSPIFNRQIVDLATFALSVNGGKLDLNMRKGDISVFRMDTKEIDVKISNIKTKIHTIAVEALAHKGFDRCTLFRNALQT